jgi:hypothetical protein
MTSRLKTLKDDLYEELLTVTAANGYNLTPNQVLRSIRHPNDVQDFPELAFECGFERIKTTDSAWGVFDSVVPVFIVATVKAATDLTDDPVLKEAAVEAARHDLKRLVATIIKKYANIESHTWCFLPDNTNGLSFGALVGEGMPSNVAMVGVDFNVLLRAQDAELEGVDNYLFNSEQVLFDATQTYFNRTS